VQYAESDLDFIQRLCAEVGIHYHFQHSPDGHRLIFGDDQTVFPKLPRPTAYLPDSGMVAEEPAIKRFSVRLETRTTSVTRRDYDFNKPHLLLESAVAGGQSQALEDYDYPGQFTHRDDGKHLARRALERHRADYRQACGSSDQSALISGYFLKVSGHPRSAWNDLWLLTEIEHQGKQPQVLEESVTSNSPDGFSQGYRNTFLATPWDALFRPPLGKSKPRMPGYQHAVVTGQGDDEIHCDKYGRVKVQFKWDRHGKFNEHSSCWLRVATGWAHDRYGSVLIPRVGMEVLVGFVDGDADKPLVMGCLPNAANPVPLDLPADKTRSMFRSRSSPGGGGYNELRIEDRKGAEEIYLRAQRDWNQHVLHNQRVQVDNDRSIVVKGTSSLQVRNQLLNASEQFHVLALGQVVIDGGANVTIQAGGHWININADGIFSSVPIEVGGAPQLTAAPTLVPPALLSVAQILSLKSDAPFCEECERCKDGVCAA
jgi:type VI secretion system secreted protein VgrG